MKLTVSLNGDFLGPFQVLTDIAAQLFKGNSTFIKSAFSPVCELNTINDWINLESWGKPAAIRAQILNERLGLQLKSHSINTLELHINSYDGFLSIDNLYGLLFLAETLNRLQLIFYVNSDKKDDLQQIIMPLQAKNNIDVCYVDAATINQEQQLTEERLQAERYALLNTLGFPFQQQWFANRKIEQAQAHLLIGYAWLCLKAGAYEIADRMLNKSLQQLLTEPVREQLFMHLQLVRFLSHQYVVVTTTEFPQEFRFLDEKDKISLYFIKAYAATMSRNLDVADIYFKKSNVNADMPLNDENSLYRLNLHALFLALQGNLQTAFTLEMRIEEFVEKNQVKIAGLKYVNFINIARLYKKTNQFDRALTYYEKAYQEIRGGGYTPSDQIYYNINIGSIHEAAGHVAMALPYWLKAAMHWLAYSNKYALSWRPRLIVCQEKISDSLKPLNLSKVNQFLYNKISDLIAKAGIQAAPAQQKIFEFVTDNQFKGKDKTCYIAGNIIVYATAEAMTSGSKLDKETNQLAILVSSLIKQIVDIHDKYQTLIIDTRNEGFYPASDEASWALASMAGCKIVYRNHYLLQYDNEETKRILNQTNISLASTIDTVSVSNQEIQINYKRSFLNKSLHTAAEVNLVARLEQKKSLTYTDLSTDERTILADLVDKKVVTISYPCSEKMDDDVVLM